MNWLIFCSLIRLPCSVDNTTENMSIYCSSLYYLLVFIFNRTSALPVNLLAISHPSSNTQGTTVCVSIQSIKLPLPYHLGPASVGKNVSMLFFCRSKRSSLLPALSDDVFIPSNPLHSHPRHAPCYDTSITEKQRQEMQEG